MMNHVVAWQKKITDWGYRKTIENHWKNNDFGWWQEKDKGKPSRNEACQKRDNRPRLLRNPGKLLQNQYFLADGKKKIRIPQRETRHVKKKR